MTDRTDPAAVAREDALIVLDGVLCECEFANRLPTPRELLAALAAAGITLAQPGRTPTGRKMITLDYDAGMILSEYHVSGGGQIMSEELDGALYQLRVALGAGAATKEGES